MACEAVKRHRGRSRSMSTHLALRVHLLLISPELRKPPSPGHPVHVGTAIGERGGLGLISWA